MHKYRSAAKQAAWYSEPDDPNRNYNPFGKIRARTKNSNRLLDYEVAQSRANRSESELVPSIEIQRKAQPLEYPSRADTMPSAQIYSQSDDEAPPVKSQNEVQRPAKVALELEDAHGSLDEEYGIPKPPRALASWTSWSKRTLSHLSHRLAFASGSRGSQNVKKTVADMGMSVVSHAPLGTKGPSFLQVPGRRRKFTIIEYAKQVDGIKGTQLIADTT